MTKALRPLFPHYRRLFAEVSRLIYVILRGFYHEAAFRPLLTGMVIAHKSFADQLRWNLHFHAIALEGGFDDEGTFFFNPFSKLQVDGRGFLASGDQATDGPENTELGLCLEPLVLEAFGFSIDNSVRILDKSEQESLAEYIARPPISLNKIRYEPFKWRVLFHTKYSEYFKQNLHMFYALDFLAELTQHIPPK